MPFNLDQEWCGGCCHSPAGFPMRTSGGPKINVKLCSVDFSSAFKTICPRMQAGKRLLYVPRDRNLVGRLINTLYF